LAKVIAYFFQAPDSTPKLAAVAAVTVANQIAWSILFVESLNHLLT
jgi:hypothetical protein